MRVGIKPTVDLVFKKLLGRPEGIPLLIHVLNAILSLPQGARVVAVELLNPFNEKDFETDKLSILDIKVRDQLGRYYNVEMQLLIVPAFRARVLYYWASLYESQLQEGQPYTQLRPTTSIIFIDGELIPNQPHWHSVFELREVQTGVAFSDHLQVHVLEIPKFKLRAEELRTPLEKWLYFLKHGEDLDPDNLPETMQTPEIVHSLKEMEKMTQTELERERYEARMKWQRDQRTIEVEARRLGLEEGRVEGRVEGQQAAEVKEWVKQVGFCERLLGRPLTPPEQLQALPPAELKQRVDDLEAAVLTLGPLAKP